MPTDAEPRPFFRPATLKETIREFMDDRPMDLSAAVSYYTLLSLAPIVLVTVSVAGLLFRREDVELRIVTEIQGLVGQAGAEVIQSVLRNASDPAKSKLSLAIGVVTLLAGATTVFVQLQDSLNRVWDVEAKPKKSAIWSFVRERLLSLAMVLGVGFLLLVSLILSTALSAVGDWAGGQIANNAISIAVITLLFAMMFKYLPDAKVAWRDVWFGALTTAVLFTIGKFLIGLYLGRASVGSAYGAAGSVVVLMVWVYYASLIFFFGAELTHVHAKRTRHRVAPTEHAVKVSPAAR
jgi:membrane protein